MSPIRRTAFSMVYVCVSTFMLSAMLSLAVDFGRAQLAKTQLQAAVDAAARYATSGISNSTYLAKAQAAALENTVDTTGLALTASDVVLGRWNSSNDTFTAGGTPSNAVRVTGYRTAARSTAIPLIFGQLVGRPTLDIKAVAIAKIEAPVYNIVGLGGVTMTGTTSISRLASESGSVTVASNSLITVPSGCTISGDAFHRATAPSEPGNGISGCKTTMANDLAYAAPVVPGTAWAMGAVNVASGTYNVAAGSYNCTSLSIAPGATFNLTGDVNIYCSGPVSMPSGASFNTSGMTYKVTLYLTAANTANISMSGNFYLVVYGPSATLNLSGNAAMVGSAVVQNLSLSGTSSISYSSVLSLASPSSVTYNAFATVK